MSVQSVPGFRGNIEVTNDSGQKLFTTPIASKPELQDFLDRYGNSREQWGFRSEVCPLIRGNVKQFACDITFPMLFNFALRVDHFATQLFKVLLAICLDLITLPVRMLAVPLVLIFSKPDSPHALKSLMEQQNPQKIEDELVLLNKNS